MTDKFKIENEHEHVTYMFESDGLANEFTKQYPREKFTVLNGKEENRLRGKCHTIVDTNSKTYGYVSNAVKVLCPPRTLLEAIEDQLNNEKGKIIGVMLCKTCLDRSIMMCEELLGSLKEIKDHAAK